MGRRARGGIVAAVGAAILVVSVAANELGIGDTGNFGWKQTSGTIIGAVVIVVGLAIVIFAGRPKPADDAV